MFSDFSCSCSPFECVCNQSQNRQTVPYFNNVPAQLNYNNVHNNDSSFWQIPETVTHQNTVENEQNYSYQSSHGENPAYDFTPITGDVFQPEEIFQLDQPLRPDFINYQDLNQVQMTNSPPTFIDLGSGTIHKGNFKSEENYWTNCQQNTNQYFLSSDDSNTSSTNSNMQSHSSPIAYLNPEIMDPQSNTIECSRISFELSGNLNNSPKEILLNTNNNNNQLYNFYQNENELTPPRQINQPLQDPKYFGTEIDYCDTYNTNEFINICSQKHLRYSYENRMNSVKSNVIPISDENHIVEYDMNNSQYNYESLVTNVETILPSHNTMEVRNIDQESVYRCSPILNNNDECFPSDFNQTNYSQFTAVSHC